jgi:hypothetical protein
MAGQTAKSKHRVTGVIDGHLENLAWHKRRDVPRQVLRVCCQRRASSPDTEFSELRAKQNFNVNINELWAPHPDRNFKRFLASLDIPLENT